jgi:hypothetical protein
MSTGETSGGDHTPCAARLWRKSGEDFLSALWQVEVSLSKIVYYAMCTLMIWE